MIDTPSKEALEWVRRQLGWPKQVRLLRRIPGATSSSLFELEASSGTNSKRFVLRLVDNPKWLEESPDIARHEAEALQRAAGSGVPVPDLIDSDEQGQSCGVPAVLMSRMTGRVELGQRDVDERLTRLASALASIHTVDPAGFRWDYDPWCDITKARPPSWTKCPSKWEKAITIVAARVPSDERRFLHRDYHPTNVLWESGKISGVVDWPNACVGPRGADVAHCRVNLSALYGTTAADRFLDAYAALAGSGFHYDPYWDLISLIGISHEPQLYRPWIEYGAALTEQMIHERRDEFLLSALAEVSS